METVQPSLFYYSEDGSTSRLYVAEFSTEQALRLFDSTLPIEITDFGATCYKKYGWAMEKELPRIKTIGELCVFFDVEGDVGLVEFEAQIEGVGSIGTHDDGECHLAFASKRHCWEVLKKVLPSEYVNKVINNLVENAGIYIHCDEAGRITKYSSFDEYLEESP